MKLRQIYLVSIGLLLGLVQLLQYPNQVFAQVVFREDFSSGYDRWQDTRGTFNLWSIVDSTADVLITTGSTLAEIVPKSEHWDESWKNYIYKLDYTYLTGVDKALSFWYQDTRNWYQFHFVGNNYILSHIADGIEVWRQSGDLILESGQTHKMEVHLKDGNIQFFMDNQKRLEYDDPTFDNDYGRIGLKAGVGNVGPTHLQFDNIEVSLIPDFTDFILPITTLKQTDPTWRNIEYDSASKWATGKFGIGEWGCLVTSINMILNYHGITTLPDGTAITPITLNQWLLAQPDGYIGSGLVNWSAVSRLTAQISELQGSVKLEYQRVTGSNLETAIEKINLQQPVILEVPGHFLVGNGFTQDHSDLFITDPAYSYQLLSQHTTTLASTRLLTPSHTDLSYIHIGHDPTLSISVAQKNNNPIENYQSYEQNITSLEQNDSAPTYVLHELSKPESAEYTLTLATTKPTTQAVTVTIFVYDTLGNLTNLTYSGLAGTIHNPTTLILSYSKDGISTLQSQESFENVLHDTEGFFDTGEIKKRYVSFELTALIEQAIHASQSNKIRYISALKKTIEWYKPHISESAKNILLQRLNRLELNLQK